MSTTGTGTKTWFITGASRGFGRVWAEAALGRGDRVAAAARDVSRLEPLRRAHGDAVLPLTLDVTDRQAAFDAVARAHDRFGRLDVIVNNAGYGLFGAIEEVSADQVREQIDTNLLGALWVTQAALPRLRAQGSGHFLQVSSIAGVIAVPILGIYNASKWALEAMSESLAAEVGAFGIRVTIVEPGQYATDWSGSSAVNAQPNDAYRDVRAAHEGRMSTLPQGDPAATAAAVLKAVDAERPPLRLFLGSTPLPIAESVYQSRLDTWRRWQDVAAAAQV